MPIMQFVAPHKKEGVSMAEEIIEEDNENEEAEVAEEDFLDRIPTIQEGLEELLGENQE